MRAVKLHVTAQMFVELLKPMKGGDPCFFQVVDHALPSDAEVVRVEGDHSTLRLIITSESYDDVDENGLPTIIPPTFRAVT